MYNYRDWVVQTTSVHTFPLKNFGVILFTVINLSFIVLSHEIPTFLLILAATHLASRGSMFEGIWNGRKITKFVYEKK